MNQQIQTITITNLIDWTVNYYCLRLFPDYFICGNAFLKKDYNTEGKKQPISIKVDKLGITIHLNIWLCF